MIRNLLIILLVLVTLNISALIYTAVVKELESDSKNVFSSTSLPAFPGAEGFGSKTPGGRGGKVMKVTTLSESGTGSLKEALEASGPRIVTFDVGGVITLKDEIEIKNPYLTIAGQTAPGDGVLIKGAGIIIATHDVIVRGLRFRVGDDPSGPATGSRDGINISSSVSGQDIYNVIVDHSSISWAVDENVSTWTNKVHDVTLQWNIISEGLYNSIHLDEGAASGSYDPHSMGMLVGEDGNNISIHHNLFAHNSDRNALIRPKNTEFINNVVYNWGTGATTLSNGTSSSQMNVNIIGNYYKKGANTRKDSPADRGIRVNQSVPSGSKVYVKGNIGPNRLTDTGDEWAAVYEEGGVNRRSTTLAFTGSGITTHSAEDAYDLVLEQAGALHPKRDSVDTTVVSQVESGTGTIIDCIITCDSGDIQTSLKGWPAVSTVLSGPLDADKDGMADSWEVTKGLNPAVSTDANLYAASGYTWIEEYINSFYNPETEEIIVLDKISTSQVSQSIDDAEENISTRKVDLTSSDLELIKEGAETTGNQIVGLRFKDVKVPQGAKITKAYIEFTVDESSTERTNLTFYGVDTDYSSSFTSASKDISKRVRTTAKVDWKSVGSWTTVGGKVTSPELKTIVQEIVDRSGWNSGNAMSFIIQGSGKRVAKSYDGDPLKSPKLVVEYE